MLEEKLANRKMIRVFVGTTRLQEQDRDVACAVYAPSKIDEIYMEFADKLSPCGKVRLKPEMEFQDRDGEWHKGVVLVPEDKSEAILAGCSMQNGRITPATAEAQRVEYSKGREALLALKL